MTTLHETPSEIEPVHIGSSAPAAGNVAPSGSRPPTGPLAGGAVASPGGAQPRTLAQNVKDAMLRVHGLAVQVSKDSILVPMRFPSGRRLVAIDLEDYGGFSARCEDLVVVSAGRKLSRDDDIMAILAGYRPVEWHQDASGDYLYVNTPSTAAIDFVERIDILCEAARMLVTYALATRLATPDQSRLDYARLSALGAYDDHLRYAVETYLTRWEEHELAEEMTTAFKEFVQIDGPVGGKIVLDRYAHAMAEPMPKACRCGRGLVTPAERARGVCDPDWIRQAVGGTR